MIKDSKVGYLSFLLFFNLNIYTDSFLYNTFNNHGSIGLINIPTARFYDESSFGLTIYDGNPDQKITMSSFPFDWLEASFFYTNIQDKPYCIYEFDPVCNQDYKDKGFNFKLRLKEEGIWPAIAIGINDIAGTGYYSSEYIVGSYGINKTDFHFGLGWGQLNGSKENFKNPLGKINNSFYERPKTFEDRGGQFQPSRYFSGETVSPFLGVTHAINEKFLLKLEYDTTVTPGEVGYKEATQDFSFGFDFNLTKNFTIGISNERGNSTSIRFIYKNNPKISKPRYEYKDSNHKETDSSYVRFIRNLSENGIGVNKILEGSDQLGVQISQFRHPNLDVIDEIIKRASYDAGLDMPVKANLTIADLKARTEFDESFEQNSKLIYQRQAKKKFKTNTRLEVRPFLASREEFFKGALMIENISEYSFLDNFFFSSNIKYSLADNFDDLKYPPVDTYPAQVRSDIKDYLINYDEGIIIGRAQFDYYLSPKKNHHAMLTAGILEEMFNGIGFEYLYFKQDSNYAIGFEVFEVKKRDYEMRFGSLDYKNITSHLNFYYRNYGRIPFDAKISYGEYLAGDEGITIDLSRSFENGTKFGIFASFTDVSTDQFGEGSFDKGIYFNIPVFGNLINYSWRPLTKDPGAKLNRKNTLHDLLIRFRPIN
ncbi:MAG: hypothetical protein CMM98_02265 [Rickettsiales bacterium]|nr:hypothetical protein [Rickettsiales bacterium]